MKRLIEKNLGYLSELRAELSGEKARNRLLYAMLGAALFCIAAHGFAYFGFAPLHDAVNYVDYHSGSWEISLGRYLEPLYGKIRGTYTMPWLCGMFSMLYTGLAAFFISDLLEIRSRTLVMMLSGFLTVNATMIDTTLEYASFGDMFALSLMLAGAGVYMVIRVPGLLGAALSVCLFLGSLGLYQSYIFVAIQLMLQYALYQALRERKLLAKAGPVWLRMAAVLAVTLAAYVVLYKGAMRFYGVQAVPSSYNSPAALASMSVGEMMEYVKAAYVNFASYFYGYGRLERSAFNVLSLMMTAAAGVMLVWQIIKKRLPVINAAFIAVVMALFPFLAQATSILTRSMEIYFLAAPGMMLLFPFLLGLIVSPVLEGEALCLRSRCMRTAVTALCAALLFVGVRMSNGLYTYQRVQYDKTHSYVTRIMERIDTTPGYVPGETPVAFAGLLSSGLINLNPPEGAEWMSGLNRSGVTYMGIFESYFRLYGENIDVITDYTGLPDYAQLDEVRAMPAYPQAGCTKMIDGTLVVKLSQP